MHGKEPVLAMAAVPSDAAVGRRGYIASLSTKREGRIFDMAVSGRQGHRGRTVHGLP